MNKRLKADFKAYLEECNKTVYQSSSTNHYDRCYIIFYEWSDLKSLNPKKFDSVKEFLKFLNNCKISITASQESDIKCRYTLHATCFKDTNILALSNTKDNLQELVDDYEISGTIPSIDKRTRYKYYSCGYSNYNHHCYSDYDDCYD